MNVEQIVARIFNSIRKDVVRNDQSKQLDIYQCLVDELEREMGRIEEENAAESDEDYDDPCPSDLTGEGD